jgi:hypothetical protein
MWFTDHFITMEMEGEQMMEFLKAIKEIMDTSKAKMDADRERKANQAKADADQDEHCPQGYEGQVRCPA